MLHDTATNHIITMIIIYYYYLRVFLFLLLDAASLPAAKGVNQTRHCSLQRHCSPNSFLTFQHIVILNISNTLLTARAHRVCRNPQVYLRKMAGALENVQQGTCSKVAFPLLH